MAPFLRPYLFSYTFLGLPFLGGFGSNDVSLRMPCLFWSILIPDLVPCLGYFLGVSRLVTAPDGSETGGVAIPVPFSLIDKLSCLLRC